MNNMIENAVLRLEFNREAGGLTAITNKITGETYGIVGDAFAVETTAFRRTQAEMRQVAWTAIPTGAHARYADADLTVEVAYELKPADHFFQKRLAVTFAAAGGVTQLTLSRPAFALAGLEIVCCRHPEFDWVIDYCKAKHGWAPGRPEGSEPARTFFGRTARGGFFTGLEMAYDNSRLADGAPALGYAPNLKVTAGERLEGEALYFGVYRRDRRDARAADWAPLPAAQVVGNDAHSGFDGAAAAGLRAADTDRKTVSVPAAAKALPLPSESAALAAMTSAILGPPRHGLMAFACGWHSQMEQGEYDTDAKLEGDLRSLEFLAGCGLDGVSDCHPWGGESHKMAALSEGERYEHGEYARRFLDRARELKLKVIQWPTMNNTHPWKAYGVPFRKDRTEWLRGVGSVMCALVYVPFTCDTAGPATFGFGMDWWYEAWLDGALISETLQSGNAKFPIGVDNHTVTVDLTPGKHVLVLRCIRGTASATLAVGGPRDLARAQARAGNLPDAVRPDMPEPAVVLPSECVVFAPFEKGAGIPSDAELRVVPAALELGGRRVEGRPALFDADRRLDLSPFVGAAPSPAEALRRTAANCVACAPFYDWLEKLILDDALGTGLYEGWCMDGDFWGTGAYFHTTIPVTCLAENHEHMPGDSNYACQRRLDRLIAEVRRRHPGMYIVMCRPPMDLGVWANRHVDAVFTLIESGTGGSNLAAGDEVRNAARIRLHHHFFPHWMDWSLLFPSYATAPYPQWPEGHLDYLLLSALSCSPNLLLYLPTKTGIPDWDKAELRKWLDWGRANVEYLLVRHDLFDWPGKGQVDGSAHLVGGRGLIFLFNSASTEKIAEFALTPESTGFTGNKPVEIRQEYPASDRREVVQPSATVRWPVPAATPLVLRVGK